MRKELVFLAFAAASCNRLPEKTAPTPLPTEPVPSQEPFQMDSDFVQNRVQEAFLESLSEMSSYPDPAIANLRPALFAGQQMGEIVINTSEPEFDPAGGLVADNHKPQIYCSFSPEGKFQVIVNSNFFFLHDPYPVEAMAARLEECLYFKNGIEEKYRLLRQSNSSLSLYEAVTLNPEWVIDAVIDAWYKTATEILVPYEASLPKDDFLLNFVLSTYESCGGNRACFAETILGSPNFPLI